jgi:hypothetical protein
MTGSVTAQNRQEERRQMAMRMIAPGEHCWTPGLAARSETM